MLPQGYLFPAGRCAERERPSRPKAAIRLQARVCVLRPPVNSSSSNSYAVYISTHHACKCVRRQRAQPSYTLRSLHPHLLRSPHRYRGARRDHHHSNDQNHPYCVRPLHCAHLLLQYLPSGCQQSLLLLRRPRGPSSTALYSHRQLNRQINPHLLPRSGPSPRLQPPQGPSYLAAPSHPQHIHRDRLRGMEAEGPRQQHQRGRLCILEVEMPSRDSTRRESLKCVMRSRYSIEMTTDKLRGTM